MKIHLANPRGFCAGVDRAIDIVEKALELWGAPIYVRHEIVHNKTVCDDLRTKGAVFVDELDEVPDGQRVIFSAHGVARSVVKDAEDRGLATVDATCPLVTKVHMEAKMLSKRGYKLILIGHEGHPEVVGTMGQVDEPMTLVGSVADVEALDWPGETNVAFLTQTTLSVDETRDIINALEEKFSDIRGPSKEDICYATTNRQAAVKDLMEEVDLLLVLGAPNSSNSNRLAELGSRDRGKSGHLVESWRDIDAAWFDGVESVGISSGASAPESLVQEVVDFLVREHGAEVVRGLDREPEDVEFALPKAMRQD